MKIDLTGKTFGRLTVLKEEEVRSNSRQIKWVCRCNCGKTKAILGHNLRGGTSASCGCAGVEATIRRFTKHGGAPAGRITKEYYVWAEMNSRCHNPNHKRFKDYGGRGITVCQSWRRNFANFRRDMGSKPEGLTLDRVDNDRGYSKRNCKWSTYKEQCENRRRPANWKSK
jgi:hypothetical protein